MKKLMTKSGTVYNIRPFHSKRGNSVLHAERNGSDGRKWKCECVAIYPDRFETFMATKTFETSPQGKLIGRNKNGKVTCQLWPDMIKKGMILVNKSGFRSTEITKIK